MHKLSAVFFLRLCCDKCLAFDENGSSMKIDLIHEVLGALHTTRNNEDQATPAVNPCCTLNADGTNQKI